MLCDAARTAPINENLLLEAHPPSMMPYTLSATTPNIYKTPILTSVTCNSMTRSPMVSVCPHGMTALPIQAVMMAIVGPRINNDLCAPAGMISSLKKNLPPSHNGCSIPNGPARPGPYLSCIKPATVRSANVEYIAITKVITKITLTNITFSMTNANSISRISNFQTQMGLSTNRHNTTQGNNRSTRSN